MELERGGRNRPSRSVYPAPEADIVRPQSADE